MGIRHLARQRERRFNTVPEVDPDHVGSAPFGGEFCMTALATAAFENDLVLKKVGFDRLQPAKKLFVIFRVFLRKMRPLPAKILRRLGLVILYLFEVGKSRHAAYDLVFARALFARQYAVDDLL